MIVVAQASLQALDEGESFGELGEARFVGFELAGVDAAAQAARLDRMLEVQHLVVEQVFDGVARAGGAVEDAADDDGVVRGVVVAERALGVVLAPGEFGAAEQAAEEARVERVEDFFEMVDSGLRGRSSACCRARVRMSSVCRVTAALEAKRL